MTLRGLACVVCAVHLLSSAAAAATRYDPRLRFRTISTARFDIHFHQGGEEQARRLAAIAEEVAARLDRTLGQPAGRVQVILVDQTDLANGWATPLPYNVMELTAAAPQGESLIGNTDDWLRLVFTHEYTHIVHLGRAAGWIGRLRRVFGRMPLLFPNGFLPLWQIEGIATLEESADGYGRLHAGDFRIIPARAAAESRFLTLDRAGGGLLAWPSGHAPYAYGARFHEFLADRYGGESLRRLADATARRPPYFGAPAFREVYGRSLGTLWREFEQETKRDVAPAGTAGTRLTHHGYQVIGPRHAPDGTLYYSVANPHAFPALLAMGGDGQPRTITTRYLGNRLGFHGEVIVFDQLELVRNVGLQSDLYAVGTDGRNLRRLTRAARASDPDVSPDGQRIVCVLQRADGRSIGLLAVPAHGVEGKPMVLASAPATAFSTPRWSPDGRSIAAERRRPGVPSEIVVVDARSGEVRPLARFQDARSVAPTWTPDGQRILFAADSGERGFQIFAVELESGGLSRLEGTGENAQSPDVSPDGRQLTYVGYTNEGQDLFTLPLGRAEWTAVDARARARTAMEADSSDAAAPAPASSDPRSYSPLPTLVPRFWVPTIESDNDEVVVGAATGAYDALGRHAYGVELGWSAGRARPDWRAAYAYDRWWPTLFASVSDDTDPFRDGEIRVRELDAGAVMLQRRVRWSQTWLVAFHAARDVIRCSDCGSGSELTSDRRALRAGWRVDAARSYGYSISNEDGWTATVMSEWARTALGGDADAGALTADVRGFVPVRPRHGVIAGRAALATAWGDGAGRRTFGAGGSGPQTGGFGIGFDAIGLLRGTESGDLAGRRVLVGNLDYRWPIWRIERGAGTLPFFARTLHASLFADAARVWDDELRPRDVTRSFGGELSLDVVLGYVLPVTFTTGVAWRQGSVEGVAIFGRIGRAF